MDKSPLFAVRTIDNSNSVPNIEHLAHMVECSDMSQWYYHIGMYDEAFNRQVTILLESRADFSVVRGGNLHGIFIYQDSDGNNDSARYKVILYRVLPDANAPIG